MPPLSPIFDVYNSHSPSRRLCFALVNDLIVGLHLNGETDRGRWGAPPNIGLSAAIDVDAAAAVFNDRKSSGTEQIGLTYVHRSLFAV